MAAKKTAEAARASMDRYIRQEGAPAPPGGPEPVIFVPFTDPQAGTFTVEVPRGWQVDGGFVHAGLGDRRPFVAVQSAGGVMAWFGDPACPQAFFHQAMAPEGMVIPYATTGCSFLNLPASGQKLATFYLLQIAPRRLGPVHITGQRDWRDILDAARAAGMATPAHLQVTIHEVRFEAGGRSGACLGASTCSAMPDFGAGAGWEGNVTVWLAPPGLGALAEQVAARLYQTFRPTQRLVQLYQHDEATIAGNGAMANLGQQQWFAGQQAAHRAQQSAGDAMVGAYWERQAAHDRAMADQAQRGDVYDGIFRRYGDATLGRERLQDDAGGRQYDAPAGFSHYWLDQATGQVVGTDTSTPPDYARNYTLLRRS